MNETAPKPGTIWTLSAGDFQELTFGLVLSSGDATARVVPLTWDVSPLPSDLSLPTDLLGFALWARCREAFPVLTEQLVEHLGEVPEPDRKRITSTAAELSENIGNTPAVDAVRAHIDSRLDELAAWRDENAPWREPYLSLEGPDLATVVHRRREYLDLTLDVTAEIADVAPKLVARLEEARLDLFADLPVKNLVQLVKILALPPSRRLHQLVSDAVASASAGPAYGTATSLSRRRQGKLSSSGGQRRGEEAAAQYTEKLEGLLPQWPC